MGSNPTPDNCHVFFFFCLINLPYKKREVREGQLEVNAYDRSN